MRSLILILIFSIGHGASASYNSDCMKLLLPPRSRVIDSFHKSIVMQVLSDDLFKDLNTRHLLPIDYEVIFDLEHGLPMIAVFTDGTRLELFPDDHSMALLRTKLITANVFQTMYMQIALDHIRYILSTTCFAMNYERCNSYADYVGLIDNKARPFTRKQEQVLKWATLYQLPLNSTAINIRKTAKSAKEVKARVKELRERRLASAYTLMKDSFNSINAQDGFDYFVSGYINDAFDRFENLTEDNVLIFKKNPKK